MAAKFSRFHENRSYETASDNLGHFDDDEPIVEKATLDAPIAEGYFLKKLVLRQWRIETQENRIIKQVEEENIGYQMAVRLGWTTGTGLGRKKQGRTEPIPLVMKEDFLCIGRLALEFDQADEATAKRRTLEIEKGDTDELQQKYQNELEKEKSIEASLRDLKEMFYCELCDKQYFKYKEYDNHINSYDHAHRQRLRELRQRESTRNIYAKKKREQKQMEKEMQRLHLLSGKNMESQSSGGFKVAFKSSPGMSSVGSGFKPIQVQQGFTAVPPPPAENLPPLPHEPAPPLPREPAPPLPREPAPPLPREPPPQLPPSNDQSVKKPFSFKMGIMTSGSHGDTNVEATPENKGISFGFGKQKGVGIKQFGVKSRPLKSTASAFMESESEEEEEEEDSSEEIRGGVCDGEDQPSTPSQQQDTLKKVIEYADTLKLKESLRPKLLIRFVKGTEMGGILPGTMPTSDKAKSDPDKSESNNSRVGTRDIGSQKRRFTEKPKESRDRKKETSNSKESKDRKMSGDNNGSEEYRGLSGYKNSRDVNDYRELKEYRQSRAHRESRDFKDSMDYKESRDCKDSRGFKESRDHKDSKERKSSNKKKEPSEGRREFRDRWEGSSRTNSSKDKRT